MTSGVVALIGNGSSISYNPDLSVGRLTEGLLDQFTHSNADLKAIAREVAALAGDARGFEELLGPFDAVAAMIKSLPGLQEGQRTGSRFGDLAAALEAAVDIHRRGTALALGLIAQRSHGQRDISPVESLCEALADLADPRQLTIATLNYDGLLTAGFLQEGIDFAWTSRQTLKISDMGDGRGRHCDRPDFAHAAIESWALRRAPDFMSARARFLNLHGSLGWLRSRDDPRDARKFRIDDLRAADFWTKYRRDKTAWEPIVVLTNRKTELTEEWPFTLCYSEMRKGLVRAERWLIAGYGFGDAPVNEAFAWAANRRRHSAGPKPRVLLVGGRPSSALRQKAAHVLDIPEQWITTCGVKLPDALTSAEWQEWAT